MNPTSRGESDPSANIRLRDVERDDLPRLYENQLEPQANQMAATHPRTASAFDAHWESILANSNDVLGTGDIVKAIVVDDVLAGCVSCFKWNGHDTVGYTVGYRIGSEFWGKGVATQAVTLLLDLVSRRPLHARASVTNVASLRVLQKCGFAIVGYEHSPSSERYQECEEAVLELSKGRVPDTSDEFTRFCRIHLNPSGDPHKIRVTQRRRFI
jgi:RimJ/RimL family protein N-acetyltransferase